jgi:hypothetical protein
MTAEAAGRGHDCTLRNPVCSRCWMTWAEITEADWVPYCGMRPPLTLVRETKEER